MTKFTSKSPHYEFLRKRWTGKHQAATQKYLETHSETLKHLTLGGLSGLMLLSNPNVSDIPLPHLGETDNQISLRDQGQEKFKQDLVASLKSDLPPNVSNLTPDQEQLVAQVLSEKFNLKVAPELQGIRLNKTYGLIGGEQHLYRYPGDSVFAHAKTSDDWAMYGGSGIAPGLGAWGYFAHSQAQFTKTDEERERWYIAVQTFLSPGFAENFAKYRDFYKYRKMLVVNPNTGQAVVADIADAGPSEWTGKSLGGSPEVMEYLGYAKGPRKGAVLYFFIDDPDDSVPLGPISVSSGGKITQI